MRATHGSTPVANAGPTFVTADYDNDVQHDGGAQRNRGKKLKNAESRAAAAIFDQGY
eukprot:m.481059 g.481059  ORF g.481059 m.481059 type:complete len:57 (+) comp22032_c0_seq1:112-282(+)